MEVRIAGLHLPGRSWCDRQDVHVGVQRKGEVVHLVPGDATEAVWDFTVEVDDAGGHLDFRGPYVQGPRGERFVYLSWGTVDGAGAFTMFRRAKILLGAIDTEALAAATADPANRLLGTVSLTGADGGPRCAAVRPPDITWEALPAGA